MKKIMFLLMVILIVSSVFAYGKGEWTEKFHSGKYCKYAKEGYNKCQFTKNSSECPFVNGKCKYKKESNYTRCQGAKYSGHGKYGKSFYLGYKRNFIGMGMKNFLSIVPKKTIDWLSVKKKYSSIDKQEFMDKYDTDGDGVISIKEKKAAWNK